MSTTSEAYLDVVGGVEVTWPRAYAECIMCSCPECGAEVMDLCINPVRGKPRRMPCVARITSCN